MKVLLICAAGMSTSMLMASMRKHALEGETIDAAPVNELDTKLPDYDVVLLGPQIAFREKDVREVVEPAGKKMAVLDMRTYGTMNGSAAMEQARKLLA